MQSAQHSFIVRLKDSHSSTVGGANAPWPRFQQPLKQTEKRRTGPRVCCVCLWTSALSDSRSASVMSDVQIMNGEDDNEFTGFLALHAGALHAAGIPQLYWRSLHHKLHNEVCFLQTFFFTKYRRHLVLLRIDYMYWHFPQTRSKCSIAWLFDRYQNVCTDWQLAMNACLS